jgi:hypothetical protein
MFDGKDASELTDEQLFKILKGEDRCSSTGSDDHPEFKKLRDQLEALGYIQCQRSWWNGDRVLKPFYLNEWRFRKGHKFPSAAAMRTSISCARKFGWKSISSL